MSEWLTTGQMIDRLKVGEVAKCIESDIKGWTGSEIISQKHMWKWKLENGDTEEFFLSEQVQKCKWIILPKYVTFEEAMKALKEGKEVSFQANNNYSYRIIPNMHFNALKNDGIVWEELLNGKWTVKE